MAAHLASSPPPALGSRSNESFRTHCRSVLRSALERERRGAVDDVGSRSSDDVATELEMLLFSFVASDDTADAIYREAVRLGSASFRHALVRRSLSFGGAGIARFAAALSEDALPPLLERLQEEFEMNMTLPVLEGSFDLPPLSVQTILGFLPATDVSRLAAVSRAYRTVARGGVLWRSLCERTFAAAPLRLRSSWLGRVFAFFGVVGEVTGLASRFSFAALVASSAHNPPLPTAKGDGAEGGGAIGAGLGGGSSLSRGQLQKGEESRRGDAAIGAGSSSSASPPYYSSGMDSARCGGAGGAAGSGGGGSANRVGGDDGGESDDDDDKDEDGDVDDSFFIGAVSSAHRSSSSSSASSCSSTSYSPRAASSLPHETVVVGAKRAAAAAAIPPSVALETSDKRNCVTAAAASVAAAREAAAPGASAAAVDLYPPLLPPLAAADGDVDDIEIVLPTLPPDRHAGETWWDCFHRLSRKRYAELQQASLPKSICESCGQRSAILLSERSQLSAYVKYTRCLACSHVVIIEQSRGDPIKLKWEEEVETREDDYY